MTTPTSSPRRSYAPPPRTGASGASSSGHQSPHPRPSGASRSGYPETPPRTQQNRGATTPPHAPRPNVNRIIAVSLNNKLKHLEDSTRDVVGIYNHLSNQENATTITIASIQDAQQLDQLPQPIRDLVSKFIVHPGETADMLFRSLTVIRNNLDTLHDTKYDELLSAHQNLNQKFNELSQNSDDNTFELRTQLDPDFQNRLANVHNSLNNL